MPNSKRIKYAHPKYQSPNKPKPQVNINKALLPDVKGYLLSIGIEPKGRMLWIKVICPFHDDKTPSLSINTQKGYFCCFACGAKGGDLIAFHSKLKNIGFIEACKQLGVWENNND